MRQGVFIRDPQDGPEWHERHLWTDGELKPLNRKADAEARAAEISQRHPEWQIEVRQTSDPLPGNFRETFARLLP